MGTASKDDCKVSREFSFGTIQVLDQFRRLDLRSPKCREQVLLIPGRRGDTYGLPDTR